MLGRHVVSLLECAFTLAARAISSSLIPELGGGKQKSGPTLQAKVAATPEISGALVIDPGLFASSADFNGVSSQASLVPSRHHVQPSHKHIIGARLAPRAFPT